MCSSTRPHDVGGEFGGRQHRPQGLHGGLALTLDHEPCDRAVAGPLERTELDGVRLLLVVEHRTAAHFLPVVVFRIDPEHRHGAHAALGGDRAGELDGRDGLVERVERPAEEPGLLAGDDGHGGLVGEGGRGGERLRRRPAVALLRGEQGGQMWRGALRTGVHTGDDVRPRCVILRIAGVERGESVERERVIRREAANPRQLTEIDGESARRRRGSGR
jgi:hypothetical protein